MKREAKNTGAVIRQSEKAVRLRLVTSNSLEKRVNDDDSITRTRPLSVLEMRLKYKGLQGLQKFFKGIKFGEKIDIHNIDLENYTVRVDMSDIVCGISESGYVTYDRRWYGKLKEAGDNLSKLSFQYRDDKYEWRIINVLQEVHREKGTSFITLIFTIPFVECLFSAGGWVAINDVDEICSLSTVAAMRLCELLSRREKADGPLLFEYGELKEYLGLNTRYNSKRGDNDFDSKVLKKAAKEMDSKCRRSFDYKKIRDEKGVLWYQLWPACHAPAKKKLGENDKYKYGPLYFGDRKSYMLLTDCENGYGFTDKEIHLYAGLLCDFKKDTGLDLYSVLSSKLQTARDKDNPQGYIVNTLRRMVDALKD